MNRRGFLKTTGVLMAGASAMTFEDKLLADETAKGAPHADKLGWRLGVDGGPKCRPIRFCIPRTQSSTST